MKTTNYRYPIYSIIVKGFLLSVFALMPNSVNAQCKQWDVSGKWILNVVKGASETLDLKQEGTHIKGKSLLGLGGVPVLGTVEGDDFGITIDWARPGVTVAPGAASFEIFKGKIGSDGIIHGFGSTQAKPDLVGDKNPWSSDRPMKCLNRNNPISRLKITPTTPPPPIVKTVKPTGRPRVDAPSMQVPGIMAEPNNIALIAGKSKGTTTLTWNGGNRHPYAEVWVKVDDEDETKLVEAGKGTLQVSVVPGKTYLYILTDAGKRLATVTVKFH